MSSKVEVLCPNGHRVYVKANPNTTLISILEEACVKHGYSATDFGLNHANVAKTKKILDLTLTMRFAGLSNNAKLELIKVAHPREEGSVTLALQVPSGERLKGTFTPNDTLWKVLEHFEFEKEHSSGITKSGSFEGTGRQEPVCVYMREEVIGEFALRETTLKQLGLISGTAIIRLIFKNVDDTLLTEIKDKINKEKARLAKLVDKKLTQQMSSEDAMDTTEKKQEQCSAGAQEVMETEISSVSLQENLTPADLGRMQTAPFSALPSIFPADPPVPDVIPRRQPDRLVIRPVQPILTDFKFPEATKGMDLYNNDMTSDREVIKYHPCERDPVCYSMEEIKSSAAVPVEPDDDFFALTVADVQKMYHEQQQRIKKEEESSLVTQVMRKARAEERLAKYDHTFIRFTFPDKLVLQATFRPKEPVYNLYKFVKTQLKAEEMDFDLFTSPPKLVLKDKSSTLIEARLVPMTVVYVSSEATVDQYLSSNVRSFILPQQEANRKIIDTMHRPVKRVLDVNSPPKSNQSGTKTTSEAKVPKWFKVGKK